MELAFQQLKFVRFNVNGVTTKIAPALTTTIRSEKTKNCSCSKHSPNNAGLEALKQNVIILSIINVYT